MTLLWNDPAQFSDDALRGFADAHADQVRLVPGGVVRAQPTPAGKVAVVVGGGSGHYPAFCGLVGEGFADGAVVGNVFTSPSADDAASVGREADGGAGVVMLTGNYAGDVMNFTLACRRLAAEGIDARYVLVTDDVASAPAGQESERRGIAGDLTVFKVAAAAAEAGASLDEVERLARHANDRTRTLGVAFDGCTLPGADAPLFGVPEGRMGIGVGIHGEPGIGETDMPTAHELAVTLVDQVLAEAPAPGPSRAAVVLNGLGRTKYEELFVVWASVAERLRAADVTVVSPDVGELVTSLDMAGCSLTLMWLDDELERLWLAPSDAPAYRKGRFDARAAARPSTRAGTAPHEGTSDHSSAPGHSTSHHGTSHHSTELPAGSGPPTRVATDPDTTSAPAGPAVRAAAAGLLTQLAHARDAVRAEEAHLGRLDAVAGDGDHGRGMVRGLTAAHEAAASALEAGGGPGDLLTAAGRAWAARAGGTSGVLWGAMLEAAGAVLPTDDSAWAAGPSTDAVTEAVGAALAAARELGRADVGDKTFLDALVPFHTALREGSDDDLVSTWGRATDAAQDAAQATADLRPRVGRARPLAEQSVGTPDPGAVSFALVVRTVSSASPEETP
ncbi:dihydroxyacetone kinase family protein [Cellulomonas sp. APG4]|uniref:dihydroxyacetone kinase family protein n=1 Tax=Cellulomonas sp. APG4 TaxID=1538656 RepID=UPI00137ABED0|nr:dihydroxyacetone kinase family protein [Cellulomonas sp. APG4]NCT89401.1 dihydroxyacetone kinase family protein [Cellulomonas sp. APG4]